VRDKATGAITDLDRFAAYVPVRLNTTYALIRSLLDREVTEINFTLPGLYADGFGVDLLRDIDGTGEDLVLARDTRSRIRGSPFLFQFGRHNRPPALFFITPAWAGLLANTTVCAGTSLTLVPLPPGTAGPSLPGNPFPTPTSRASLTITSPASIDAPCAGRNETFTLAIPLESIDPDEDNITFSCDPECPRTIDAAEADQFISYFDGNWSFQVRAFDSAVADTQRLELRLGT
jgi:hypothetical protein